MVFRHDVGYGFDATDFFSRRALLQGQQHATDNDIDVDKFCMVGNDHSKVAV